MRCIKSFFLFAALLLALSACTDAMYTELDIYYFDLGMATRNGNTLCFLMDDSTWLYPENSNLNNEIVSGKRYNIHYRLLEHNSGQKKKERYKAEVLDLREVPILPIEETLKDANSKLTHQQIRVDRIWLGGGFLNISYHGLLHSDGDELQRIQMINQSDSTNGIQLMFHHFKKEAQSNEKLQRYDFCLSFPLTEVPDFNHKKTIKLAVFETQGWTTHYISKK
nr:hypothetical protein [Bacteroidales bacterium]